MSRYGWSIGREQISPYSSMPSGVPAVTDDDFSYITSQDLDGVTEDRYYPRSHSTAPPPAPEDDVLLIKNRGITYPAHFPAYAIGDGKLRVIDVKDRVGLMMELPERGTSRIKLLYKGKQLKDPMAPVRDYGVKNNSELMAVMPEINDVSSGSEEEMVIVDAPREDRKTRRRKKKRDKKKGITSDGDSLSGSPRDSASTFDHPRSPPAPPTSSGATSGPMKVLDDLAVEYQIKWLPLCSDYIESPPSDPKKREEEHRKLSESIMMHIMLKLDGVEAEGMPEVRARRKELASAVCSEGTTSPQAVLGFFARQSLSRPLAPNIRGTTNPSSTAKQQIFADRFEDLSCPSFLFFNSPRKDGYDVELRASCRHRWQGPSPWPTRLHCRQAAPQRPEDRYCPLRGSQHLWRVLPCEAQVPRPPPKDHPLQPHPRWSLPLPRSLPNLLQGCPWHDPPQDRPWCCCSRAPQGLRGCPPSLRQDQEGRRSPGSPCSPTPARPQVLHCRSSVQRGWLEVRGRRCSIGGAKKGQGRCFLRAQEDCRPTTG